MKWFCLQVLLHALGCSLTAVEREKRGGKDREGGFCEQCGILFMPILALTRREGECFLEDFFSHSLWNEMARAICL